MEVSLEEIKKLELPTEILEYFEDIAQDNYVDLLKVRCSNFQYLFYYLDKVPNREDIIKELINLKEDILHLRQS